MRYEIDLMESKPALTAVIRGRVAPAELARFVPAACGEVWTFFRTAGLPRPGRHTSLYLPDGVVEVGAEISEPFIGNERIHCSQLPGGTVATTVHFGPYGGLKDAHTAIREWCGTQQQRFSGTCWEIYGHWKESWNTDPSAIRTDIFYLLDASKGQKAK